MKVSDSFADEIAVEEAEASSQLEVPPETHWKSIYISTFLAFVGAVSYFILFSAYWPYLQTVDKTATEEFYGYCMAMYSVGQLCGAPLFGHWTNVTKKVKIPVLVCFFSLITGNFIYLILPIVPFPAKYALLLGRFLDGLGSNNQMMLKLYITTATAMNDRNKAAGFFGIGQSLSSVCGPVLQLAFSPLGYPGFVLGNLVNFDIYTAPVYCSIAINLTGICTLLFFFREKYPKIPETKIPIDSETASETTPIVKVQTYDIIAVLICLLTRFTDVFFTTNLEALGSAFSMHMFNLTETKAVEYMAAAQTATNILYFLICLAFTLNIFKMKSLRSISILSLISLILFYLLTYSYPFLPGQVELKNNATMTNAGCDAERFSWCETLHPINIYLYYAVWVLINGIGYSIQTMALLTVFSTVLGNSKQGTWHSLFQISGGCAKILGSSVLTILYTRHGPKLTWTIEIAVLVFTTLTWMVFYQRMVPFEDLSRKSSSSQDFKIEVEENARAKKKAKEAEEKF